MNSERIDRWIRLLASADEDERREAGNSLVDGIVLSCCPLFEDTWGWEPDSTDEDWLGFGSDIRDLLPRR